MKEFAKDLKLPPKWWWGIIIAVAVAALIFLAAGSKTAFLICALCAAAIAALAWTSGALEARGSTNRVGGP